MLGRPSVGALVAVSGRPRKDAPTSNLHRFFELHFLTLQFRSFLTCSFVRFPLPFMESMLTS